MELAKVRYLRICLFTVCPLTLFYSHRPYHFFSENTKLRLFSGPDQAVAVFNDNHVCGDLFLLYVCFPPLSLNLEFPAAKRIYH